jgi:hypothetical protein
MNRPTQIRFLLHGASGGVKVLDMTTARTSKAMAKQATAAHVVGQAVPGVVVSIPGAGWYVTAKGGARHPLDNRPFDTATEAREALRIFNGGK